MQPDLHDVADKRLRSFGQHGVSLGICDERRCRDEYVSDGLSGPTIQDARY